MSIREDKYNGHTGLIWFLFCLLIGLIILYFYDKEEKQPKQIEKEIVEKPMPTVEEDNSAYSVVPIPQEIICPH